MSESHFYTSGTVGATSPSLLERVKANDADAWRRLARLYTPMVYGWARKSKLQRADAFDVTQEVFRSVASNIASFRRDRPSDSFRGWLRTITRNEVCNHFRRRSKEPDAVGGNDALRLLSEIPELSPTPSATEEKQATADLARRALRMIKTDFDERTWRGFLRTAVGGESPAHVAEDLGVTVWTVYKAKSRVLHRLREEFGEFLE